MHFTCLFHFKDNANFAIVKPFDSDFFFADFAGQVGVVGSKESFMNLPSAHSALPHPPQGMLRKDDFTHSLATAFSPHAETPRRKRDRCRALGLRCKDITMSLQVYCRRFRLFSWAVLSLGCYPSTNTVAGSTPAASKIRQACLTMRGDAQCVSIYQPLESNSGCVIPSLPSLMSHLPCGP